MTDNRTTELRKLLDERGVKYDESTQGNTTFFRFDYRDSCGDYLHTIAITGECISAYSDYLTPEQAIAATLGSEREKRLEKLVRIYGEIGNYFCERFACCDAEFANCKYCIGLPQGGQCELGWCNDESKALGIEQTDYGGGECEPVNLEELYYMIGELENELAEHGTLTAEQVREAAKGHYKLRMVRDVDGLDVPQVMFDWQAIADELNARTEQTCEYVIEDNMNESDGMGDVWFRCTNCDMCFDYADDWLFKMPYCPHCGARVKARNE